MHPFPFSLGHLLSLIVLFMLQISFDGSWLGGSQSLISDFSWFPLFPKTKHWDSWDTLKLAQVPTSQVSFLLSRTSSLWSCYFKRLALCKAYTWQVHVSGKLYASVSRKMLPSEFWRLWGHCRGIILQSVLSTIVVVGISESLWEWPCKSVFEHLFPWVLLWYFVIWLSQSLGSSWSWLHLLPQHRQRGAETVSMMKAQHIYKHEITE